jgi:hypothetical protein
VRDRFLVHRIGGDPQILPQRSCAPKTSRVLPAVPALSLDGKEGVSG